MKKAVFYFLLVACLSSALAATTPPGTKHFIPAASAYTDLDPALYSVYITCSDFAQLFNLHNQNNKKKSTKKIVLQFYYTKDGVLTLAAFGGKKRNRWYDSNVSPVLTPYKGKTYGSIAGVDIYLGDQEISRHNGCNEMLDIINQKKYTYFVFVPVSNTITINQQTRNYLTYNIIATNDITKPEDKFTSQPVSMTNPSPPKNGN